MNFGTKLAVTILIIGSVASGLKKKSFNFIRKIKL